MHNLSSGIFLPVMENKGSKWAGEYKKALEEFIKTWFNRDFAMPEDFDDLNIDVLDQ